jgi:hypothetical protein
VAARLVIQNNRGYARLTNTVVAQISSNFLCTAEPTHPLNTPEG